MVIFSKLRKDSFPHVTSGVLYLALLGFKTFKNMFQDSFIPLHVIQGLSSLSGHSKVMSPVALYPALTKVPGQKFVINSRCALLLPGKKDGNKLRWCRIWKVTEGQLQHSISRKMINRHAVVLSAKDYFFVVLSPAQANLNILQTVLESRGTVCDKTWDGQLNTCLQLSLHLVHKVSYYIDSQSTHQL